MIKYTLFMHQFIFATTKFRDLPEFNWFDATKYRDQDDKNVKTGLRCGMRCADEAFVSIANNFEFSHESSWFSSIVYF